MLRMFSYKILSTEVSLISTTFEPQLKAEKLFSTEFFINGKLFLLCKINLL